MARVRTTQIEATIRAAMRAGLRSIRLTVDYETGKIEIEGTADRDQEPKQVRSLDTISFRAA